MKEWMVMADVYVHLVGKAIGVILVSTMKITKEELYCYTITD